jgi:hypothetical protein
VKFFVSKPPSAFLPSNNKFLLTFGSQREEYAVLSVTGSIEPIDNFKPPEEQGEAIWATRKRQSLH